jgi:hypothetical protein
MRPPALLTAAATTSIAAALALLGPPSASAADEGLRINQVQVVGSHNSYHQEATPAESALRAIVAPDGQRALEYTHAALPTQFSEQQVRQIELDVWADPNGGLYARPLLRTLTFGGAYDPVMKQPGTKVLHIQDLDYHSNCLTFRLCLQAVKGWSDANPTHVPIAVLIEFKDTPLSLTDLQSARLRRAAARQQSGPASPAVTGSRTPATTDARAAATAQAAVAAALLATPLPWTTARMDTVDADIRAVFGAEDLITPDDVRGDAPTLEDAVLHRGWPTLERSRGRTMFLMDNDGAYRDSYLSGHPSLQGRVLFTNSTPGQPDAAFVKENDPTGANQARIQDEVRRGYLVRTRADADTAQARSGDTTTRDAALASGAQWVSTDYPDPSLSRRFGTTYAVRLPDGPARCTPIAPVNTTTACTAVPGP